MKTIFKKYWIFAVFCLTSTLGIATQLLSQETASPKEISGTWQGILKVSGMSLRIVFNISVDAKGNLAATMDSPDQGATGIPVNKAFFKKDSLRLEVQAVRGGFTGKLAKKQQSIIGHWSQSGQSFPLNLERVGKTKGASQPEKTLKPVSKADQKNIVGIWQGVLKISAIELRIVFKISATPEGTLVATMDSPDQGAKNIPTGKVIFEKDSLRVEVPGVGGFYEGKLAPAKAEITGKWTQAGRALSLDLKRVEKELELKRPQEPKKPYPYDEEEVRYENKAAGVELAGTLTKPRSGGPFPAVLLISGSGPQDRNETIVGHKPFLVLADFLTRKGIAVLRVDDRGVGKSTGDFSKATTKDFASDALAGVAYLKSRDDINAREIGLIGHSEGGIIAPMVAVQSPDVAFIVLMAGTGLTGEEILLLQKEKIFRAIGASEAFIKADQANSKQVFAILKAEPDDSIAAQKIREFSKKVEKEMPDTLKQEAEKISGSKIGEGREAGIKIMTSPWFRFFLTYDPRPALRKVKCPVLAIVGEKDLQVPPKENLQAIEKALKAGGNREYTVQELKGLNHLFQTAETGAPSEYSKIEETISPTALQLIADWILRHIRGTK